jgi:hypothetical protein
VNLDNDCCLETTSDAFRIGSRTERERIIELIETEWSEYPDVDSLIALIKGENTDKAEVHTSADNAVNDTEGENK